MKILKIMLLIMSCMMLLAGCSGSASQKQADASAKNKPAEIVKVEGKTLVAYYSQTGTTKKAAEEIQKLTGADIFEIKPVEPYPAAHAPCLERQKQDIKANARPAVAGKVANMEQYKTVFVGFPVWYYQAPMLINTFLESYNLEGKRVIPFCTSGGHPIDSSVEALQKSLPKVKIEEGLRVTGDENELKKWLQKYGYAQDQAQAKANSKASLPVKLVINGKTFEAVLYDTKTTQSLLEQAPLKVQLNRGSRDFCGGNINVQYTKADVVRGYKNGDLMYWIPGKNFVIFTNGEESSADVGELVPLGKLKGSVKDILALGDMLEVVINKE